MAEQSFLVKEYTMPSIRYFFAFSLLAILSACSMGSAQTPIRQPICDSVGFLEFAQKAEQPRVKRLLSEADFAKAARDENTVVLDARGAFTIRRQYVTSVLLLLAVAFCGWAINNSLWTDQIKRYGPDPSEAVLYCPPLACSGLALFTAMIVAAWATLTSRNQVT
jgi:hypothetical protein